MDIAKVAASSSSSSAPLDLHISIFVTCLCNPESVPPIPNSDVMIIRPSVRQILLDFITPPVDLATEKSQTNHNQPGSTDVERHNASSKLPWFGVGGGVAVCASGPASLTSEASNAVAWIQMSGRGASLGGLGLHTEVFDI